MSTSDRVAQLHLQALGSHFVAFHDSQSYGGVILSRLHAVKIYDYVIQLLTFWTLFTSFFVSKATFKRLDSGKKPIQVGPVDRVNLYLRMRGSHE
jgi:hypothetical protein